MKLQDIIPALAGEKPKTVVVPFANDVNIIRSISHAIEAKIAHFILIGEEEKIHEAARSQGVDISGAEFIFETDEQKACDRAAALVRDNEAQVMIKGLVQSASFIRAILHKENKLIQLGKLISCVSIFELPSYHKLLFITDAAINISPTLEQKIEILRNAIDIARRLGITSPKVACIESVENVKSSLPGTVDAKALKDLGREGAFGDAEIDGPLGFDVAISKKAAEIKGIKSSVAGDPDILLLPQLITANVLYKAFIWCSGGTTASIVAGAKVPIVLTSRSDSEETKLLSIGLALYLASK
jgi:phosphate butyryltransferase